jgi:hypothetical protein
LTPGPAGISERAPVATSMEEPARLMLAQLFDLTPDGSGFVVRRPQGESETLGIITVVEHWFEEFRPRR